MAQISPIDPAMPPRESLEPLALELARLAGSFAHLPQQTGLAIRQMVRIADAHYSLSIDGHRVHPVHIEEALYGQLNEDARVRGLQREAVAHLKAERFLVGRMADPGFDLVAPAFLKVLHWELYSRIPEEFRWVVDGAARHRVIPGDLRTHAVTGRRLPPAPELVESLLQRFRGSYEPSRLTPIERVVAAPAAHHRLLWIHPFAGGNGRVARLVTAGLLERAGIDGALGGCWSMSRGLGLARERYRELLTAADLRVRHDLDGREVLSPRGLLDFVRFFLERCRDELVFMRRALRVETLVERINQYIALRAASMAPGGALHPEAASLLRDVALRGEIARGEATRVTGMAVSEARKVLSALVKERLLVSDSPKGPVRLGLPAHAAPFLFPDLYGGEMVFRPEPHSAIEAA